AGGGDHRLVVAVGHAGDPVPAAGAVEETARDVQAAAKLAEEERAGVRKDQVLVARAGRGRGRRDEHELLAPRRTAVGRYPDRPLETAALGPAAGKRYHGHLARVQRIDGDARLR